MISLAFTYDTNWKKVPLISWATDDLFSQASASEFLILGCIAGISTILFEMSKLEDKVNWKPQKKIPTVDRNVFILSSYELLSYYPLILNPREVLLLRATYRPTNIGKQISGIAAWESDAWTQFLHYQWAAWHSEFGV